MVHEVVWVTSGGGRVRSTEVARVFGAFFGRPDGFGSSDFAQIVICLHALSIYMGFRSRFWTKNRDPLGLGSQIL